MKLKVFDAPSIEEKTINLMLIQGNGSVHVVMVDEKGKRITRGSLLTIRQEGIAVDPGVDPAFGFSLDYKGSLLIS